MAFAGVLIPIGIWDRTETGHRDDAVNAGGHVADHPLWPQCFTAHIRYEHVPDEKTLVEQFHEISKRLKDVARHVATRNGRRKLPGAELDVSHCELYLYEVADATPSPPDCTLVVANGQLMTAMPEPAARFIFNSRSCMRVT